MKLPIKTIATLALAGIVGYMSLSNQQAPRPGGKVYEGQLAGTTQDVSLHLDSAYEQARIERPLQDGSTERIYGHMLPRNDVPYGIDTLFQDGTSTPLHRIRDVPPGIQETEEDANHAKVITNFLETKAAYLSSNQCIYLPSKWKR